MDSSKVHKKDKVKGVPKEWYELKSKFDEYLSLIAKDHHKRRDGNLIIEYSYDGWREEGEYVVTHDGYVNDFYISGDTLEEVINGAIVEVDSMIEEKKGFSEDFIS